MPQFADAIPVKRELAIPLTEHELSELGKHLAAKKAEADSVKARKREAIGKFNAELEDIDQSIDKLAEAINHRTDMRLVDCEERRDLETGEIVTFRLDREPPEEVSRKPFAEDEKTDPNQPSLFDKSKRAKKPAPVAPSIVCNAIDEDGEVHAITAEQADAIGHELRDARVVRASIGGSERAVVKVVRGKACETCGIVNGHRPECASLKLEEQGLVIVLDTKGVEHTVDLETANDVREANRCGTACPYTPEGGEEVDLAMVKGEPVYGVTEIGERYELTPDRIAALRQSISDMGGFVMSVDGESVELIAFEGMQDDDRDDGAATLAELGGDVDGKPKRAAKKPSSVKVKPKRAKKGAPAPAEAE